MIDRRTFLRGAAGATGLALVAGCSSVPDGVPDVDPGPQVSGSFTSALRGGARTGWTIAYPPGHSPGSGLPVTVALHGRGGNHRTAFDDIGYDRFLADAVHKGVAPFAIAAVDGGDHEYWHPRQGTDPAGMVIREFVPLLGQRGLDVRRIGLLGWSMGGYGALYLTTVLRTRVAACAVGSPAIWHHSWQSAEGAFDDAADFDEHAIFPRVDRLRGVPMRIDCGDQDGFAPVTRDLRAAITPTPAGGIEPGKHDSAFWRRQAPAQLRLLARHLA